MNHVYEFLYCECIHESAFATISVHRTKFGAYKAMRKYLEDEYAKWFDFRTMHGKNRSWGQKFGMHEAWCVRLTELMD